MSDKIWPTSEQNYAVKSVLPIEYPPAATYDGRSIEQIREEAVREYQEEQARQAEDATEYLIAEIARIRTVTPRSERVRSVLEDALKDAIHNDDGEEKEIALSEEDQRLIGRDRGHGSRRCIRRGSVMSARLRRQRQRSQFFAAQIQ